MFKSLNKGISTPIAIVIIVICAVLVGGIVAWQYYRMPKGEEEITEVKPPEEIMPPEDETADWKTYRNEKYGFEFKYPGDANFDSVDYTNPDDRRKHNIGPEYSAGNLLLSVNFSFITIINKIKYGCANYEIRVDKTDYKDIDDWVEDMRQKIEVPSNYEGDMISGKLSSVEDTEIQGKRAKKITIEGGFPFATAQLGVISNDKLYTINYSDLSPYRQPSECFGEVEYRDIFNKVLSTFRFLE